MRCLVVEDDADIRADLARALQGAGFVADEAGDGETAWYRGDVEDYDAVVLDLGLPRLDGLSVLRRWRANGRSFPVIVLSARSDWTEKVEGIDAGADDYLAKPFEMGELVARVRGLVRRGAGRVSGVVDLGRLRLDTTRMTAAFDGAPARISPLEFRLLDYLAHQGGRPVSARLGAIKPGVEGGSGDPDRVAQPLHLEGGPVVSDELEAAHQFVSPAKYFAAARRMSRSVANVRSLASSSATRARSRATSSPSSGGGAGLTARAPRTGTPAAFTHADNVASLIPKSVAICTIVAPSVTR